ncbi:hypothetical protein ALC62_01817 [Cyphomyrmex costatus]|uniref:CCHC-type domain-containing protein n=1 Tax=Cyphomyrmex costatus TaxID=456900 RepID=A0A151IP13_9HYME|nr:hypothetical protein ALC62_01817 [Cyphomyrmex costatus]
MVDLKTASAANNLVKCSLLQNHNLKAYIPTYRTLRIGVIRDVSIDIDDEMAKRHLVSQSKIIEVNCLMLRTVKDGKAVLSPSKSLCIKFAGQSLPKFVSLFYTKHAVSTFIPKVRICYNCYRSGHISKSCRSKARCMRCGDAPHANTTTISILISASLYLTLPLEAMFINDDHSYANVTKSNARRAPLFSDKYVHTHRPANSPPQNHSSPSLRYNFMLTLDAYF